MIVYLIWWLILTFAYLIYFSMAIVMDVNAKKRAALKNDKAETIVSSDNKEDDEESPEVIDEKDDDQVINGIPIDDEEDNRSGQTAITGSAVGSNASGDNSADDAFSQKIKSAVDSANKNLDKVKFAKACTISEMMDNDDDDIA